ncbi:MAG: 4-diphosphocytidyl-2-C-methyl-D-erythritol kinase [Clostridia bacterium]|nr:4-diphosphocytidyl-2-C-methyl-D-erythritol kinase [Clostridia bacterium]
MDEIIVPAYAKINLTLKVLGQRADGYHDLSTIFQAISLHDEVIARKEGRDIDLVAEGAGLPSREENLIYRAALLLKERFGLVAGVRIYLKKRLPVAAGLGGGSADAAATLLALNYLFDLGLMPAQLMLLGAELGADVPFCLLGGTALGRGRGERLTLLPPPPRLWLVLVKPPFGVSTAEVYRGWDAGLGAGKEAGPDEEAALEALNTGKRDLLLKALGNDLEGITCSLYPQALDVKKCLFKAGAEQVIMCGSGPTFFGVVDGAEAAEKVASRVRPFFSEVFVAHTL